MKTYYPRSVCFSMSGIRSSKDGADLMWWLNATFSMAGGRIYWSWVIGIIRDVLVWGMYVESRCPRAGGIRVVGLIGLFVGMSYEIGWLPLTGAQRRGFGATMLLRIHTGRGCCFSHSSNVCYLGNNREANSTMSTRSLVYSWSWSASAVITWKF